MTFNNSSYICGRYAQCWARITKNDMEIQRYNRLIYNLGSVSRWLTNKAQPSYEIARHLDVAVKELLVSSEMSNMYIRNEFRTKNGGFRVKRQLY